MTAKRDGEDHSIADNATADGWVPPKAGYRRRLGTAEGWVQSSRGFWTAVGRHDHPAAKTTGELNHSPAMRRAAPDGHLLRIRDGRRFPLKL